MNITFTCPKCDAASRAEVDAGSPSLNCEACGQQLKLPAGALDEGHLRRCLVCPSTDLFVRKDFPQRLGVAMVVMGIVGSSIAWGLRRPILTYAILFGTALVDLVLYLVMPDALMCYRCGSVYRGASMTEHEGFSLETHERYRQQTARLGGQRRA